MALKQNIFKYMMRCFSDGEGGDEGREVIQKERVGECLQMAWHRQSLFPPRLFPQMIFSLPKHRVSPNFYQTDQEIQLTGCGWKENRKTVKSETDNGMEGITPINSLAHFKAVRCGRGQLY